MRPWCVLISMLVASAALAAGCARPMPPPGGERDVLPPGLVATTPEALSVVAPSTEPVVFRFDERLSERNFTEALIIVSPLDGGVRVERAGNEVRVSIDGGWRADRIYRVILLPGIRDLFGNVRNEAAELVFSTGPPVPATALGGLVIDRIAGRAAVSPVVDAVRRADTARYTAIADSAGFFSLRHLPLGVYDVRAWADANRNRRREAGEAVDSGRVVNLSGDADTVAVIFQVLAPDTTPPAVTRAAALDSLHVRVVVDDYTTAAAAAAASAEVFLMPDSTSVALSTRGWLEPAWARGRAAVGRAARDSVTADSTAAADSAAVQVAAPPAAAAPADTLPVREIVFALDRSLAPGAEYVIVVRGLRNLHGLTGGGAARFETAPGTPPPPQTPVRSDTASIAGNRADAVRRTSALIRRR